MGVQDFEAVVQTVAVGVGLKRIRLVDFDFVAVLQSVAVGVRTQRVGASGLFLAVRQTVPVGVCLIGIGPGGVFVGIADAVVVGVAPAVLAQVAEVKLLPFIGQPVVVGVELAGEFLDGDGVEDGVMIGIVRAGAAAIEPDDHRRASGKIELSDQSLLLAVGDASLLVARVEVLYRQV